MKTYITTLVLVFALASGTSFMALTGHDPAQIDQNGAHHTASHQKTALLY